MSLLVVGEAAVGVALFGGLGTFWLSGIRGVARHERSVLKEHAHAARANLAAVEAAEDDPIFSPEAIEQSVREAVALADDIWRGEPIESPERPDERLIRTWARLWQSRLGSGLVATAQPSVDLLSVVNRNDEEEDRIVMRVRFRFTANTPGSGLLAYTTCTPTNAGPLGAVAAAGFCSP
jgi:hypothetical protein